MRKLIYILFALMLSSQLINGQGKTLRLQEKDRGQDVLTLIQRIQPYRIMINPDDGIKEIYFNYEVNSINHPQGALIFIDGMRVGNDIEILKTISVSDIETITVMTRPEDYAIYTSLNANGVIVVKTKRGEQTK